MRPPSVLGIYPTKLTFHPSRTSVTLLLYTVGDEGSFDGRCDIGYAGRENPSSDLGFSVKSFVWSNPLNQ